MNYVNKAPLYTTLYTIEKIDLQVRALPEDRGGGLCLCPTHPHGGAPSALRRATSGSHNHLEDETMSRKDYVAIAAAIRQNIAEAAQRKALAEALIPALRASNDRFSSSRFLAAAVGE